MNDFYDFGPNLQYVQTKQAGWNLLPMAVMILPCMMLLQTQQVYWAGAGLSVKRRSVISSLSNISNGSSIQGPRSPTPSPTSTSLCGGEMVKIFMVLFREVYLDGS